MTSEILYQCEWFMTTNPKALTSLASKKERCLSFPLVHMAGRIAPMGGGKVRKLASSFKR